jgi:hypothetical protein
MARTGHTRAASSMRAKIRRMRREGFSVREIARQTHLSKTFVHDVSRGKRRLSAKRAAVASERLAQQGGMRVIVNGHRDVVRPLRKRDRSKIGKFWNVLEKARRRGDYALIRKSLSKAQRTIHTTQGTQILESDLVDLRKLDDAGLLTPDEILIGESA